MDWEYEYNRLVNSALKLNDIVNHLVAELEIRKGVAKVRQERIDKAIEYIEKLLREETEITDEDSVDYGMKCQRAYFSDSELGKVLEILKGEDIK